MNAFCKRCGGLTRPIHILEKDGHKICSCKIVLCHGVFDVIHAGHLAYFEEAKKYGDRLVVSITTDRFVNKGPGRPYFTTSQRAEMLRSLRFIDVVCISDEPTAVGAIQRVRPDFYVKGPDYKDFNKDVTGEILNEKRAVEEYGGKLVFTDTPIYSSSTLINKFLSPWSDQQKEQIERINSIGGFERCKRAIDQLENLKVLVIGEPILDVYRFVNPEGISSKSPTVSCRFQYEEKYRGGAWAIFNHLRDFVSSKSIPSNPRPLDKIPKKIRYIAGTQRVFEVTEINENDWWNDANAIELLNNSKKTDCIIAADFGHGLFEGPVLEAMNDIKGFVGLNVQTNSSNFGFNVYTKHKRFDYLCLDTREGRLATHDRFSDPIIVARRIAKHIKRPFGFTAGSNGAYLLNEDSSIHSPAFSDIVIDATGAGDAYFAITSVLLALGCNEQLIPFIGNVFAGLKTKIIGNKEAVSKASLLKAIRSILA